MPRTLVALPRRPSRRTAPNHFTRGCVRLRQILHPRRAKLKVLQIGEIDGIGLAHVIIRELSGRPAADQHPAKGRQTIRCLPQINIIVCCVPFVWCPSFL
jgi:hypothetical protein